MNLTNYLFYSLSVIGLQSASLDPGSSLFSICSVAVINFQAKVSGDHFFHLPLTSLKIWLNFVLYYGSWTIWHVTFFQNYSSHLSIRPTVKQENYYMPNGLTYKIYNKIPQIF